MTKGEKIRKARLKASMTQQELSEKSGINSVSISQYEKGLRNPKVETLKKFADALQIPLYELMTEEEMLADAEYLTKELKAAKKKFYDFMADFKEGFKEQIQNEHGIYRCDICIRHNTDGKYCSKHDCDGFSHWKWRGEKDEV